MKKYIIIGIIIVVLGGGYFWFRSSKTPSYITATVARGSIAQEVSANGSVATPTMINLQFQNSGKLTYVGVKVGDSVKAGEIISRQDSSILNAQLQQAQATVNVQQAKLEGLQVGSRPEDIATSQAALDKANQDLANMYTSIKDVSTDSYAKANDAVRTQLDPFFSNSETQSPSLAYMTSDSQTKIYTEMERSSSGTALNKWQDQLTNIDQSNNGLETLLQDEISYLATIRQLLNSVSGTLNYAPALGASTLAAYRANISTALNETNTATTNLDIISQNIASQKLTISQLQAQLDLKKAGSLPTDISAQQAQVAQAQANITSIQAQIAQMTLTAPVDGVITQANGSKGEIVSPGDIVVSIIPNVKLQIDVNVSEANIANVKLGDSVAVSLDAFPGTEWQGTVTQIDPAQTIIGGAVYYKTTVVFNKPDDRIKSGMTANVLIETGTASNTLIIPVSAIQNNSTNTFVQLYQNGKITNQNVITGLKSQDGMIEIISGISEGQLVVTGTK